MTAVVGIVDYQSGNIRSVTNAMEHAGASVEIVGSRADLARCSHLVLPGVGAFGFCAERLRASGLLPVVTEWAFEQRRPLLGICVGMQLMADVGVEQGRHDGLGWMGGTVTRLDADGRADIRVPHVGWNDVEFLEAFGPVRVGERLNFYFDHSYAYDKPTRGHEVGICTHGRRFGAMLRRDNIVAVQFHPEKSQEAGMRILQGFFDL